MPKTRDILVHVTVEQAQRQRICRRHNAHKVSKGELCLVIATNDTNDPYSYCVDAAKPILDAAWAKLLSLYVNLGLSPPCQSHSKP
jgi:hypothetical protein